MLAILQLLLGIIWAALATTRLRPTVTLVERIGLALVIGLIATSLWLPFLATLAFGIHVGGLAALGLTVLLLLVELVGNRPGCTRLRMEFLQGWQALRSEASGRWLLGTTLAFAALAVWLCHNHYFMPGPDGLYSAGVTWSDSTIHSSLASAFLERGNLHPPEYPFFAGWPLGYPFLPDFAVANLMGLGLSMRLAFIVTTWLALLALFLLLYGLARRWVGTEFSAAPFFAVLLFFCSGGLGFLLFLNQLGQSANLREALAQNYTFLHEYDLLCGNVVGNLLLASRCAAFGMPIALAICLLLTLNCSVEKRASTVVQAARLHISERAGEPPAPRTCKSAEDFNGATLQQTSPPSKTLEAADAQEGLAPTAGSLGYSPEFIVAGVLAGTLPLVHSHSFVVVGFVTVIYACLDWRRAARWVWFFGVFALLALPQVYWVGQQLRRSTPFFYFITGFPYPLISLPGLRYWVWNGGLFLFLVPVAWWQRHGSFGGSPFPSCCCSSWPASSASRRSLTTT